MEQKVIQCIRSDYSPQKNTKRTLDGYAKSIKTLADDLYAKDTHFIFELIQNAEDNAYETEKAHLRFVLTNTDSLTGYKNTPVLIVENNEIGFQKKHVEAICSVGQSTKSKDQGYIGEKGIGFKSVFRITSCPYVFSQGYNFKLPEIDDASGLGYIVPSWVDSLPKGINKKITSIYLPLDKSDFSQERIITSLQDIAPETILFLKKLKSIEIEVNLKEDYQIIIEKDDSQYPLVKLTYLQKKNQVETITEKLFWMTSKDYVKPEHINHEKRKNVKSRDVSVAIPLDEKQQGKLFAYLPVWENTGMPFLINADFLLVSSRESVKENEPWNDWLRECISEVYCDALVSCLSAENLSFEQKIKAYGSLPMKCHHAFLEPEILAIQEKLKHSKCIFTAPERKLYYPFVSRNSQKDFWELLNGSEFPNDLFGTSQLVCSELDKYKKELKTIGVKPLSKYETLNCLDNEEWLYSKPNEWLLKLYRYLKKHNIDDGTLVSKRIVRVAEGDEIKTILSSVELQPIYFECEDLIKKTIDDGLKWLKKIVPIAFLDVHFNERLFHESDSEGLKYFMAESLKVRQFSMDNYCVNILNVLRQKCDELSTQELIDATEFLTGNGKDNENYWSYLPVVLNSGEVILLDNISYSLVVPENYDCKLGWQRLWTTNKDRENFYVLSSNYKTTTINVLLLNCKNKIHKYPDPERIEKVSWGVFTNYEKECKARAPYSTQNKTISNWRCPENLKNSIIESKQYSEVLLEFLKTKGLSPYIYAEVYYFYYSGHVEKFDSEFF